MIHVHVGRDYYGAVQPFEGTKIVTRFWMVSGFPCWPLDSAIGGRCRYHNVLIQLNAFQQSPANPYPEFLWIPIRIVPSSVAAAYLRGVAGALILLAVIPLFFAGIMYVTRERPDFPLSWMVIGGTTGVALGLLLGAATYLSFRRVSQRQRAIRLAAIAVYGMGFDPALMFADDAATWALEADETLTALGISEFRAALQPPGSLSAEQRWLLLMRLRLQSAMDPGNQYWEQCTDRLLPLMPEGRDIALARNPTVTTR